MTPDRCVQSASLRASRDSWNRSAPSRGSDVSGLRGLGVQYRETPQLRIQPLAQILLLHQLSEEVFVLARAGLGALSHRCQPAADVLFAFFFAFELIGQGVGDRLPDDLAILEKDDGLSPSHGVETFARELIHTLPRDLVHASNCTVRRRHNPILFCRSASVALRRPS